jgi:serine/threonine-protein kinase
VALSAGTRLGPYEIVNAIGAGGMGEVYRARDTALHREVAIKVLPDSVADDTDRLARFRREAEALAALNHPNIAQVYGLEGNALVMELVEGEDLSALIERASAVGRGGGAPRDLDIDDALQVARQIAEALEAAHERGIVHRDLKPGNVKVRSDGTVKVLDFGLAKAMDPPGDSSRATSNSPTLTARATQAGLILGTAAYMAPEQARGKAVDTRADIWAFGVVLFELLSGRRMFAGEEVSDVLAAVLRQEIDWRALPSTTPPPVRHLLERCLDRDPKTRLRDIGEARVALARASASDSIQTAAPAATTGVPVVPSSRLPWIVAAALAVGLAGVLLLWAPWQAEPVDPPVRLLAHIGADVLLEAESNVDVLAVSPDGTELAFAAEQDGTTRIFVRRLEQLRATPLAGTEGATLPFFSPNGEWLAFFADGYLRKIPVTGGEIVTLTEAGNPRGGVWLEDETILFTPETVSADVSRSRLMRIASVGGEPQPFVALGDGAQTQRWPQALPGGKAVLYTEHSAGGAFDGANLVVAPLDGGAARIVVEGGYHGRYVPTGHVLFMREGSLLAVRFDPDRLETSGPTVTVLADVAATGGTGAAQFTVSASGMLLYMQGHSSGIENQIYWLDQAGNTSALTEARMAWANPRLSPDGLRLAFDVSEQGRSRDISVYDLARDTTTQLTFDPADDIAPEWTPDGRRITFASDRAASGIHNLYWVDADGSGNPVRLTDSPLDQRAGSWDPTGRYLAYAERSETTGWDVKILAMEGDEASGWTPGAATDFLSTRANEMYPSFSPDGRWIAVASNETGPFEIYVRPFPGPGGKWRLSTDGGQYPRWSRARPELLIANQTQIFSAPYADTGDSFMAQRPRLWSPTGYEPIGGAFPYDIHPDGTRLALLARQEDTGVVRDHVVVIANFADYLRELVPDGR